MPINCSVPGCVGNYKTGPKVSIFRFPKDELMQKRWIVAIRRKDFIPTKNSAVCELHFKKNEIETESSAYDSKTGRTLTAPLGIKRLKKGVIPSLLIPRLNAEKSMPSRENPEEKRMRKEKEQLNLALQQSLKGAPDETSEPEDAPESNCDLSSSVSRQSDNKMVENEQKKTAKRKRMSEKELVLKKKISSVHNSNSGQRNESSDIPFTPENNKVTYSKDSPSNSITKDAEQEQQKKNLSHSQMSSSFNSVNTEINERSKNHQVQVKEEKPWEEEYGVTKNSSKDKLEENDMVKIVSVESSSIEGIPEISQQMGEERITESYDTSFYKKPLQIDKRDEVFGNLVACEMSDLRGNPELYLKTQQSILKLLVEAHFEQMSSV